MAFESIQEILDSATEKEREAVAFYTDISKKEIFARTKKTFEDFAGEEQKHVELLENLSKNKEQFDQYKFEWIPDMKRSDFMVDIEYEEGMHYLDILRLAMKREEKSLKLYNELAEKAEAESLTRVFRMLSQEEAGHKRALETIYDDYMAEQGD